MKKFELTSETKNVFGRELHRIKALIDFGNVKAGDLGGYVEKEENLSQCGAAWVYDTARVCGTARVCDAALVCGAAWVCGAARVCGNADYLCFKGLGSKNRNTTFFKTKDGEIGVRCGCFSGSLQEFEAKVKETHGNSKYAKEYLACAEVVKIHFELEE